MPIIKSAQKQMRGAVRKRAANLSRRKAIKGTIKSVHDQPTAETLKAAFKAIDKAAKVKTIHRNKAARLKSRLAKKVK